eukprot:1869298-Rhodomonas_salina.8
METAITEFARGNACFSRWPSMTHAMGNSHAGDLLTLHSWNVSRESVRENARLLTVVEGADTGLDKQHCFFRDSAESVAVCTGPHLPDLEHDPSPSMIRGCCWAVRRVLCAMWLAVFRTCRNQTASSALTPCCALTPTLHSGLT